MVELDEELDYDSNIPESFRAVQLCLNSFEQYSHFTIYLRASDMDALTNIYCNYDSYTHTIPIQTSLL